MVEAQAIAALVSSLLKAGATPEAVGIAVEAYCGKPSAGALRTRKWRLKTSPETAGDAQRCEETPPHAGATRADTETTTSSVPTPEKQQASVSAKPRRVMCLMPDDFVPRPETFDKAQREWGCSRAQVMSKRDALHDWSHAGNKRKADWDLVVQGALRRDFEARQTGPPVARPSPRNGLTAIAAKIHGVSLDRPNDPEPPPHPGPTLDLRAGEAAKPWLS